MSGPAPYLLKPAYTQAVIARARVLGVPDALARGVADYVARGVMPGFLLRGILTGDVEATIARMDVQDLRAFPLGPLVILVREFVPEVIRGSRAAVECHIGNHARWRAQG